jgi:hypothetical protein
MPILIGAPVALALADAMLDEAVPTAAVIATTKVKAHTPNTSFRLRIMVPPHEKSSSCDMTVVPTGRYKLPNRNMNEAKLQTLKGPQN